MVWKGGRIAEGNSEEWRREKFIKGSGAQDRTSEKLEKNIKIALFTELITEKSLSEWETMPAEMVQFLEGWYSKGQLEFRGRFYSVKFIETQEQ